MFKLDDKVVVWNPQGCQYWIGYITEGVDEDGNMDSTLSVMNNEGDEGLVFPWQIVRADDFSLMPLIQTVEELQATSNKLEETICKKLNDLLPYPYPA